LMPAEQNKDAGLKKATVELLGRCGLENLVVDREVHLNLTGKPDDQDQLQSEREIDVVARFSFSGKQVLLLFECENSKGPSQPISGEYRCYDSDLKRLRQAPEQIKVLHSKDGTFQTKHLQDVDQTRLCFIYGADYAKASLRNCLMQARKYSFLVWNYDALRYFLAISSTVGSSTKYELFKEFNLNFEQHGTYTIPALEIKQKGIRMYLGTIHPGQLLKIAYVTRRARRSTHAYQRMLSRQRIQDIATFVSSKRAEALLPNTIIVVFDSEMSVQNLVNYHPNLQQLDIPRKYCSAWIIDGQHRAFGFVGTKFADWSDDKFEPFDLPIVIFRKLDDIKQTKTFITINENQKKIKSELLCDLSTMTGDISQRLTWASAIAKDLNDNENSPLFERVKVTELDVNRPISLSSLVQFGLLQTLLGFKKGPTFSGPLAILAPIQAKQSLNSETNRIARQKQVGHLIYFLKSAKRNTESADPKKDPWQNTREYSLLKATGINALFLTLARIMEAHPNGVDYQKYLKPLRKIRYGHKTIVKAGGGWVGFRELANRMIRKLNAHNPDGLKCYGQKNKH
jgi:DGQHR domain-containing protein